MRVHGTVLELTGPATPFYWHMVRTGGDYGTVLAVSHVQPGIQSFFHHQSNLGQRKYSANGRMKTVHNKQQGVT